MKLIKTGKFWFNPEQITQVRDDGAYGILVSFVDSFERYQGADAVAMREWLDANTAATFPRKSNGE